MTEEDFASLNKGSREPAPALVEGAVLEGVLVDCVTELSHDRLPAAVYPDPSVGSLDDGNYAIVVPCTHRLLYDESGSGSVPSTAEPSGVEADVYETIRRIVNFDRFAAPQASLTLIGHCSQPWLSGLVRAASNYLRRRVRCVRRSDDCDPGVLDRALRSIEHSDLVIEGNQVVGPRIIREIPELRDPRDRSAWSYGFDRHQFSALRRRPVRRVGLADGELRLDMLATSLGWKDVGKALGSLGSAWQNTFSSDQLGLVGAGRVVATTPGAPFRVGDVVVGPIRAPMQNEVVIGRDDVGLLRLVDETNSDAVVRMTANLLSWMSAIAAIDDLGTVEAGQHVFVQSGMGALGRALIGCAIERGAVVWSSVGNEEKLADAYAQQSSVHFVLARGESIPGALVAGGAPEFDCIVSTVSGPTRTAMAGLLGPGGVLVDLGKPQSRNEALSRAALDRNRRLITLDLDQVLTDNDAWTHSLLCRAWEVVIDAQRCVPVESVPIDQLGALLSRLGRGETHAALAVTFPAKHEIMVGRSQAQLDPQRAFVVSGGYGAVGGVVTKWLVSRGARNIWLVGRNPPVTVPEGDYLQQIGAKVTLWQCDVSNSYELSLLRSEIERCTAGIGGVIHCAGTTADAMLGGVTFDQIATSFGGKVHGATALLRTFDSNDHFTVLMSSVSNVLGVSFQPTYCCANSVLDHIALDARRQGRRVTSLHLGPMEGDGMANNADAKRYANSLGLEYTSAREVFDMLDTAVCTNEAVFGSYRVDWRKASRVELRLKSLSHVAALVADTGSDRVDALAELGELALDQRVEVLDELVWSVLAQTLGLSAEDQSMRNSPLSALGLDSLSAVEIEVGLINVLQTEFSLARFMSPAATTTDIASAIAGLLEESESQND